MSMWSKKTNCLNCKKEMVIKSFRKNPGKRVMGKGYICAACLRKEKKADAAAAVATAAEAVQTAAEEAVQEKDGN